MRFLIPERALFFTPSEPAAFQRAAIEIKGIIPINQVYIAVKEKSLFSLTARDMSLFFIGSPWGRMGFARDRQEDRTSKNMPEAT